MKKLASLVLLATAPAFAEPPTQVQMPDMGTMFMQQFDTNRDGKVALAEFLDPSEKQFREMDENNDGVIDKAEIESFGEKMRARMEQAHKQYGGGEKH